MKSAYARRGTMITKHGRPHYFALTFTGALWKLWRLRRAEHAGD